MTLRVGDETVTFLIEQSIGRPKSGDSVKGSVNYVQGVEQVKVEEEPALEDELLEEFKDELAGISHLQVSGECVDPVCDIKELETLLFKGQAGVEVADKPKCGDVEKKPEVMKNVVGGEMWEAVKSGSFSGE